MFAPKVSIAKLYRTSDPLEDRSRYVRLDRNERTIPFPPEVTAALIARITPETLVSYPSPEPFYRKLARWLKVDREMLLLSNGSDAAIKSVFETYVEPGDEVVFPSPSYAMYSVYCEMFGAVKVNVHYDQNLRIETEALLRQINPRTRLVIVANPNQPIGTVIPQGDLVRLIASCAQSDIPVLIDEAYYPFHDETLLPFVSQFPNLIVTRTFSKACGLASIRLGYLVSHADNIAQLFKTKTMHDLNAFSVAFGEFIVENDWVMWDYVKQVRAGRAYLEKAFEELGLEALQSHANFLLIRLPESQDAHGLVEALKHEGYLIRGPSGPPLERCIRLTVGPEDQMHMFMDAFGRCYKR